MRINKNLVHVIVIRIFLFCLICFSSYFQLKTQPLSLPCALQVSIQYYINTSVDNIKKMIRPFILAHVCQHEMRLILTFLAPKLACKIILFPRIFQVGTDSAI